MAKRSFVLIHHRFPGVTRTHALIEHYAYRTVIVRFTREDSLREFREKNKARNCADIGEGPKKRNKCIE